MAAPGIQFSGYPLLSPAPGPENSGLDIELAGFGGSLGWVVRTKGCTLFFLEPSQWFRGWILPQLTGGRVGYYTG